MIKCVWRQGLNAIYKFAGVLSERKKFYNMLNNTRTKRRRRSLYEEQSRVPLKARKLCWASKCFPVFAQMLHFIVAEANFVSETAKMFLSFFLQLCFRRKICLSAQRGNISWKAMFNCFRGLTSLRLFGLLDGLNSALILASANVW